MDPLLVTQALTLLLLIVSETLSLTKSPYYGIIHAIVLMLQKEVKPIELEPVS